MTEFFAKDWIDPDGVIVASGERLAQQVLPALRRGERITIHTEGLEGLSSSYFNIFLAIIRDDLGLASLGQIAFECASPIHRAMLERSLTAVLNPEIRNLR